MSSRVRAPVAAALLALACAIPSAPPRDAVPLTRAEIEKRCATGVTVSGRTTYDEDCIARGGRPSRAEEERRTLQEGVAGGILLGADVGQGDAAIAAAVHVGVSTVYRTKRRCVEESVETPPTERVRPGASRKHRRIREGAREPASGGARELG